MEKFAIRDVLDVTFYEINADGSPGKPVLYFDTLKVSNLERTAESVSVQGGKGNPELLVFNHSPKVTINIQDALFSMKSLAMLAGMSNPLTGVVELFKMEEKAPISYTTATPGTPGTGAITVTGEPDADGDVTIAIGGVSRNIAILDTNTITEVRDLIVTAIASNPITGFVVAAGAGAGAITVTQAAGSYSNAAVTITASAGSTGATFATPTYTPGTNPTYGTASVTVSELALAGTVSYMLEDGSVVTLPTANGLVLDVTGIPAGLSSLDIFYRYNSDATAETVSFSAKRFPGTYMVVGDTLMYDGCSAEEVPVQLVIPKAKLEPGFKIDLSATGDPAVFDFNLQSLQGCTGDELFKFIKY